MRMMMLLVVAWMMLVPDRALAGFWIGTDMIRDWWTSTHPTLTKPKPIEQPAPTVDVQRPTSRTPKR